MLVLSLSACSMQGLERPPRPKPIACMSSCASMELLANGSPTHVLEVTTRNFRTHKLCEAKRQCLIDWIEKE